ncbi:P2X purinoceptor 7-like isoform X2 [Corticium candelabrum]|nr:P2X purinoceptor 7-like isoform X2 [Corticium candelabrum]
MSESDSGGSDDDDQTLHVPDTRTERLENTEWCTCGLCIVMPSITECICCKEVDALNWRLHGVRCATAHDSFHTVCLHYEVLRTAVGVMNVSPGSITEPLTARLLRLAAYRQFTHWAHEMLGRGVRIVIPSCVVSAVRRAFPEESGHYVG